MRLAVLSTLLLVAACGRGLHRRPTDDGAGDVPPPSQPPAAAVAGPVPAAAEYTTNVGPVEFRVSVPQEFAAGKPRRAAFYLHGDLATDYLSKSYAPLRDYALSHGYLFVAALAPNGESWWKDAAYSDEFAQVVATLEAQYSLVGPHLYGGASGGSTFLTMLYLPRHGVDHPGAVAAICGGAHPKAFAYDVTETVKKTNPLVFTFGSDDFLASPTGYYGDVIHQSIDAYRGLGFPVTVNVLPGKAHCAFDWPGEIVKAWETAENH